MKYLKINLPCTTKMYLENMTKGELKAFIFDTIKEAINSNRESIEQALKVNKDELSTVKEVCSYFKISKPTLYNWLNKGVIQKHKIGNGTRLKISEIEHEIKMKPYLFGLNRDYNYRSRRLERHVEDLTDNKLT